LLIRPSPETAPRTRNEELHLEFALCFIEVVKYPTVILSGKLSLVNKNRVVPKNFLDKPKARRPKPASFFSIEQRAPRSDAVNFTGAN
jgi:hypothetical protein